MGYIAADTSGEFTAQITRLLRDESSDNIPLLLEIIEGGGVNRRIIGYLFGIAVFYAKKPVADQALSILRRYAGAETVKQAEKLREGATYHYNESEYLGKYQNPEFDIFDFILANKMCLWHRASAGRSAYFEVSHRTLQLANYPERCVSASIATLDFIRYITLPAHKNFDLVAAMEHLQHLSLESVHLENIRLDSFPTVLFGLSRLRTLTIKKGTYRPRSPMQVFADHHPLGSATLEKLSIDGYPISGEQFLGPFPALKEVEITRCSLERIDFLQDSLQLTHLILRSNHLAYLPELLGKCTKLKWLDASNNPFQKIELDLRELQELVHLEISLNR
jgi:hypothetical protein